MQQKGFDRGSAPGECLLKLLHQRMRKPRLLELGKIFEDARLPGLLPKDILLSSVFQIEHARFIEAAQEHERVGTVAVKPYLVRRQRDRFVSSFKCLTEIPGSNKIVSQSTDPADAVLQVFLP